MEAGAAGPIDVQEDRETVVQKEVHCKYLYCQGSENLVLCIAKCEVDFVVKSYLYYILYHNNLSIRVRVSVSILADFLTWLKKDTPLAF